MYLSIVSDGMAQSHCKLPRLANLAGAGKPLPQHIQGIIAHGRTTILYIICFTLINDIYFNVYW